MSEDGNERNPFTHYSIITPELKQRLSEILHDRTVSSRERFRSFIARSRHSPSKAMTIMQKQKSVSKTITVESLPTHADFWSNLYKLRNDNLRHNLLATSLWSTSFFLIGKNGEV